MQILIGILGICILAMAVVLMREAYYEAMAVVLMREAYYEYDGPEYSVPLFLCGFLALIVAAIIFVCILPNCGNNDIHYYQYCHHHCRHYYHCCNCR